MHHTTSLRSTLTFVSMLVVITLLHCTETIAPFLISDSEEMRLGNEFYDEITADKKTYPPFDGDLRVRDYIDSLGALLADVQNDRDTLTFTFTIIDNPDEINAFAIPGGHVFIYTGLLKSAESGAEVAGVLAHEIGHITCYHGRNLLLQRAATSTINSILFGDSASVAGAVAGILENMVFLGFSRDNEFEADSCAVAYTAAADINPKGMQRFLEKLREKYGEEPEIFEPFSTHPPLSDRISKVETIIDTLNGAKMGSDVKMFADEYDEIRKLL